MKQSIDPESFIQPPAEEKPLLDQQVDKGQVSLQIVNMATIQAQAINWLWSGWLPLGKLTILAGAGGCGKTNLLLALIATITTNGIFPDGSKCTDTGKVLIYSTEDDPNDTLLPRLIANGADLSKIDFIAGRINDKGEREPFDPTKDLPLLNAYAKQNPDIKLLMIDPIISAVGGDSNKATDVRRSLQVVVDFAQEFNCAVVGITHFAKGTSGSSPAERIIGSQAFTALARMVWSAAKREDENDCILVRAKSNISTLDGGIKYQIEPETVLENIETTKTAWLGTIEGSARELLSEAESTENSNGTTVDMAKEFLIDLLSSVENMPSKEVQSQAKDAGFSPASIRRAQEKLNIKPFKPQGEKIWFWSLPKIHRLDEPTHF
ncbi:AAA family ATPase [Acinetobacter indicus]|uniref:AAA family ATPase n=1 Tax=Acinetobacter indicus TaxID=756892 RepID=UPI0012661EB7|nr:AAA family ATPase [Acinetobacter indicus]QFS16968.1 AAA family ATPase [Acinetobacter indicus]